MSREQEIIFDVLSKLVSLNLVCPVEAEEFFESIDY
jgi:hypothetical protein